MLIENLLQNLLGGTLSPFLGATSLGQQATFIRPLTASNQGTAANGFAQGGMGGSFGPSRASIGPLPPGVSPQGNAFLGQFGGLNNKGIQIGTKSGMPSNLPKANGLNAGIQGDTVGAQGTFQQRGAMITGDMAKDAFGRPILNSVNGKPVPSAPQAYRTDPLTGQRQYLTDENGNTVAQNLTSFQAAQAGLSAEELRASGYTWFAGQWVYNPSGGSGSGQGTGSNLTWWQKEGFDSEKKANQYYTDKKRAEKKRAEREDPKKNGQFKKKGAVGVTAATSIMGTG